VCQPTAIPTLKRIVMKTLRLALLVPVLAVFATGTNLTHADGDQKVDKGKIVGKWEVAETEEPLLKGAAVEFTKDGKITLKLKFGDKEIPVEGKYEISGSDLKVTTKGQDEKEKTDTYRSLKTGGGSEQCRASSR
jgi:uncharacterized protein (TIGR03066 family)